MVKNLVLATMSVLLLAALGVIAVQEILHRQTVSEALATQTELQEQLVIKEAAGRLLVEELIAKTGKWVWASPEAYSLVKGEGLTLTPHEDGYEAVLGDARMFFIPGEFSPRYRFSR